MHSIKWLVIFFTFHVCFICTQAQDQNQLIDSLKKAWHTQTNDTLICKALNQLASKERSEGWQKYFIELQQRAEKGLTHSNDSSYQKFYTYQMYCAKEYAAYFERLNGNNDLSIQLHLEAYKYAEKLKKTNSLANICNSIGQLFALKGDVKQAIEYYEKGMRLYESIHDSMGVAKVLNNIGTVHNDFGEKELARSYFQNALQYSLTVKNALMVGSGYNNIGSILADQKKYDSALYYFSKAIPFYAEAGLLYEEGITLTNIGSMYQLKNDKQNALNYFEKGLMLCQQAESSEGVASSYCYLADIWFDLHNHEKAKLFADSALALGHDMGAPEIMSKAAFQLSRIYKASGKYKQAYEMHELFTRMKDSMNNEEAKRILMKSQFQFEYGKKAATDSLKTMKDKQVLSLQIKQQKTQKLFLFSILGLALVLGIFIYNRYRVTDKQKKIIETNNKDLERQHLLNQKIFSVISHDFRGPMLSLSLLLNSFRINKPSPELNTYIDELGSQLSSANTMMDNLLNWAKTELNVNLQEKSEVNVLDTVNEIVHQFHTNLEAKNIYLEKNIAVNASIYFPSNVLKIVLRNVLSNAIKFSYNNSSIQIIHDSTKNHLRIIDKGIGITNEKLQQLFKKEVLSSPGTNYENGFGIGLFLVFELLKKHGARIEAMSALSKGSEFVITFEA